MLRRLLLALLLAGCAHQEVAPRYVGTVRLFGEQRVVGYYVSPTAYQHYIRAQLAVLEGKGGEAVDELRRALASDGASPYLRTRLGEELMAQGRLDEARGQLEMALELDAEFVEALVDLGKLHLQLGDVATAERQLRRALAVDPRCEEAYLALADSQGERGDLRALEQTLRALLARVPQSAMGHYRASQLARWQGEAELVRRELERALVADPYLDEACRALGEQLIAEGQSEQAAAYLRACYAHNREVGTARLLMAAERERARPEEADDLLEKLIERPGSLENRLAVVELLLDLGLAAKALGVLDAAALAFPASAEAPLLLLARAGVLAHLGRVDEARAVLSRVPPSDTEWVRARVLWARLLCGAERWAEATSELRRLLATVKKASDIEAVALAWVELAQRQGDAVGALAVIDRAIVRCPRSDELALARARALASGGRLDEAEQALRLLIRRRPPSADALAMLGSLLMERGAHLDEARRCFEHALVLAPAAGEVADRLGALHLLQGRMAEAERTLLRARRLLGESPQVEAHLGMLWAKQGKRAEAAAALRRAIAASSDEQLRRLAEEELLRVEDGKMGLR